MGRHGPPQRRSATRRRWAATGIGTAALAAVAGGLLVASTFPAPPADPTDLRPTPTASASRSPWLTVSIPSIGVVADITTTATVTERVVETRACRCAPRTVTPPAATVTAPPVTETATATVTETSTATATVLVDLDDLEQEEP